MNEFIRKNEDALKEWHFQLYFRNRFSVAVESLSKDRNEIIDLFNDTLNDIKTYYKYKEYVRYYYNGYKDNLEEGEDYENHKELLSDLSDKINIIINSMRHYLNINSIGYTELNDKYNFDDNTSTLVHKILDESLFQSIYNNDVLKTIYNKELISNTTLK